MKSFRIAALAGIVAVLVGIGLLFIPSDEASSRVLIAGTEMCWEIDDGGETSVMTVVMVPLAPNHYFFSGQAGVTPPDPQENQTIFGNAEVMGNKVIMSFTTAGGDDLGAWGWIGRAELDAATLNGTAELVGIQHEESPEDTYVSYEGDVTLTRIACP